MKKSRIRLLFFFSVFLFPGLSWSQDFPSVEKDKYTSSAVCGRCHVQIYDRWKESLHARAYDNPIFDVAYTLAYRKTAGKAKEICLPCHAPTTIFTGDFDHELPITREGVTCDFCHTVKDVNLHAANPYVTDIGLVKRGPLKGGKGLEGKHEIAYSKLHTKSEFCAGCHEYRSRNDVLIIGTYTEWKEGPYAAKGTQCQDCHMPQVMGQIVFSKTDPPRLINEHNLVGGHSLAQLKKAVKMKIANVSTGTARTEVMVDISNAGSGHRVPTGIPTRKLVLNVEVTGKEGRVFRDKIIYEKVLMDLEGKELITEDEVMLGYPMQITKDNRLAPGETRREVFTFYVAGARVKKVLAWLDYSYKPRILSETAMQVEMARDSFSPAK